MKVHKEKLVMPHVRPNYFILKGHFRKNEIELAKWTPYLYTYNTLFPDTLDPPLL